MRISKTDWLAVLVIILGLIGAALLMTGCALKTVIVPAGDPVRIREDIKAKVWTRDDKGEWIASEAVIPAGWYALPDPGEPKDTVSFTPTPDPVKDPRAWQWKEQPLSNP